MKKTILLFVIGIFAFAISLTSCKKDKVTFTQADWIGTYYGSHNLSAGVTLPALPDTIVVTANGTDKINIQSRKLGVAALVGTLSSDFSTGTISYGPTSLTVSGVEVTNAAASLQGKLSDDKKTITLNSTTLTGTTTLLGNTVNLATVGAKINSTFTKQ
jgi:hypothetical protein